MLSPCNDAQHMNLQVANLKVLKRETNIPLVQLLDSPATLIPEDPMNRVSVRSLHLAHISAAASNLLSCLGMLSQHTTDAAPHA